MSTYLKRKRIPSVIGLLCAITLLVLGYFFHQVVEEAGGIEDPRIRVNDERVSVYVVRDSLLARLDELDAQIKKAKQAEWDFGDTPEAKTRRGNLAALRLEAEVEYDRFFRENRHAIKAHGERVTGHRFGSLFLLLGWILAPLALYANFRNFITFHMLRKNYEELQIGYAELLTAADEPSTEDLYALFQKRLEKHDSYHDVRLWVAVICTFIMMAGLYSILHLLS